MTEFSPDKDSPATVQTQRIFKYFAQRHWQILTDLFLFVSIAIWVAWRIHKTWMASNMGYVEIAFAVQNLIFLTVILARRSYLAVDRNPFHQLIAIGAFFSGLAFMGQPPSGGETALAVSRAIMVLAHLLSAVCIVTLGRSFGILIALRKVRTHGVYRIVRHPMYTADILLRTGYLVSHLNIVTSWLFIISVYCYIYRAILEERFLRNDPEYRDYMKTVRFRFIPFVF